MSINSLTDACDLRTVTTIKDGYYLEHEQTDGNRYENNGHDRQTSPSNNPEFQEGYILPSTCNYLRLLDEDFQEITYDQIPANSGVSNVLTNTCSN